MEVAWIGLTVFSVLSLRRGLEFRRGTNRDLLGLYRSATKPIVWRHLPLLLPFMSGWMLVLLLASGLFAGLAPPHPTRPEIVVELTFGVGCFVFAFFMFSITIGLMYWPPRWIIPAWLPEDDERVGFKRPKPGWLDRFWLLVGLFPAVIVWFLVQVAMGAINAGVR